MTNTEKEAETQAEGEQAPCQEPNAGFDPGTPGLHPGPKASACRLYTSDAADDVSWV